MKIEILNWDKYNPRNDVKSSSWFRLQNDFWISMFNLDNDQKMIWLVTLGLASRKMSSTVDVEIGFVAANLKVSEEKVTQTFLELQTLEMIKIVTSRIRPDTARTRHAHGKTRVATNERTNERTERTNELTPPPQPTDLAVGSEWFEFAKGEMPWKAETKTWSPLGFAECLARVQKVTSLNETGIREVLKFIREDEFWRKNAVSPGGLLKKSNNGNRKIDNILVRMRSKSDRLAETLSEWAQT